MEQNSNETIATPDEGAVSPSEPAAAPVRRRSRRATAATGEAVAAPVAKAAETAEPTASPEAGAKPSTDAPSAEAPADDAPAPKKRATRSRKKPAAASAQSDADQADEAPKKPVSAAKRPAATDAPADDASPAAAQPQAEGVQTPEQAADSEAPAAPKRRTTRSRKKPVESDSETPAASEAPAPSQSSPKGEASTSEPAEAGAPAERPKKTRSRGNSNSNAQGRKHGETAEASQPAENDEKSGAADAPGEGAEKHGNSGNSPRNGDAASRSSRTRQRERKRRGQNDDLEPEITEDDVLLPVAGILDVLDNYAFVRTSGYLPGTNDVYVSLGQVKKYGLRKGDAVVGAIRQPRDGEGAGRQKYNAIVKIDAVNSHPVEDDQKRVDFNDFTPINPDQRLRIETSAEQLTQRVIDLFAPIGMGQRGLITGAHGAGKTTTLRQIAASVAQQHPDVHLMLVLVDARPEEVTELQRTVDGEVIGSTFDRPAEDHITVAELAIERAKRLVELGHDVVVLLDTVTSLGRAYQLSAPPASRHASAGFDVSVLAPVKRLLGAAQNVENGGSLTIVASAQAESVSGVDELILEELQNVWNLEIRLSGELAAQRVFPAIDLGASSTRREDLLRSEAEAVVVNEIRRAVLEQGARQGLELVLGSLRDTASNAEYLALAQRSQGLS